MHIYLHMFNINCVKKLTFNSILFLATERQPQKMIRNINYIL